MAETKPKMEASVKDEDTSTNILYEGNCTLQHERMEALHEIVTGSVHWLDFDLATDAESGTAMTLRAMEDEYAAEVVARQALDTGEHHVSADDRAIVLALSVAQMLYGKGVKENFDQIVSLLEVGMGAGNKKAIHNYAVLLEGTTGTNTTSLIELYTRAGYCASIFRVGILQLNMSTQSEQIRVARAVVECAANADHPEACYMFGTQSLYGWGTEKIDMDLDKAQEYLSRAFTLGVRHALLELTSLYETGYGGESSVASLVDTIKKGAELDIPSLMEMYGRALVHGIAGEKDDARGYHYLNKAGTLGALPAKLDAIRMLNSGRGVRRNPTKARKQLLVMARDLDYAPAQFDMFMEFSHEGNKAESLKYLEKSAKGRYVPALATMLMNGLIDTDSDEYRKTVEILTDVFESTHDSPYKSVARQALVKTGCIKQCAMCKTVDKDLLQCARCATVHYCSQKCQSGHWNTHRLFCKRPDTPIPT